jgi:hypothetical protein
MAVSAAAAWAIAQQLAWPVAVRAALAAVAAVVVLLIPELRQRRAESDRAAKLLRHLDVPTRRGALPLVRDLRLQDLRVHDSVINVPYIPRDPVVEDRVDAAVRERHPLLIVGHSMSGKTRLAAQRTKATLPDAQLLAPASATVLRDLIDAGLVVEGVVVWLDDLDRFLKSEVMGLDLGMLKQLEVSGAVVVATIRRSELSAYRPTNVDRPPQWEVLRRFEQISLRRQLSPTELSEARQRISDTAVLDAIERYGLAEYLGGGLAAIDYFDAGETENPVGHALVRAAVDWRRAGLARLVPRSELTTALPIYLDLRPEVTTDDEAIENGLTWATKRINETVALLAPYETRDDRASVSEPFYEAFDYLVDVVGGRDTVIPVAMWQQVIKAASAAEAADVNRVAGRYFVGRTEVMAQLAAWLSAPLNGANGVTVTGAPGSGKSAVLARLELLAEPSTRQLLTSQLSGPPRPALPRIDLVTSSRWKSADQLVNELCHAAGLSEGGHWRLSSMP